MAWIDFSWFASAYDTHDWVFRLVTMVQIAGVLILTLGLPEMIESVHAGNNIDNPVMVAGYVVMRVAMVGHWLPVMRQNQNAGRAPETSVVEELEIILAWREQDAQKAYRLS